MQSPKRPKVRQTFGCPFSVINTRNGDSLLGRLTQSSRDLHFERPLCGHGSNYHVMVYFAPIPAVGQCYYTNRYKAEAAARATLMQTEALQHRLCSSVMR